MILVVGGVFQGKLEFAKTLVQEMPDAGAGAETDAGRKESGRRSGRPVILTGERLVQMEKEAISAEEQLVQAGEKVLQADIIADLHLYLRFLLEQERDVAQAVQRLLAQNPDVILTVAELGSGIVPMEAFERTYRETVGRICCTLAGQATAVYRVTCGIGLQIK